MWWCFIAANRVVNTGVCKLNTRCTEYYLWHQIQFPDLKFQVTKAYWAQTCLSHTKPILRYLLLQCEPVSRQLINCRAWLKGQRIGTSLQHWPCLFFIVIWQMMVKITLRFQQCSPSETNRPIGLGYLIVTLQLGELKWLITPTGKNRAQGNEKRQITWIAAQTRPSHIISLEVGSLSNQTFSPSCQP